MSFRRRGILYTTGALLLIAPPVIWTVSSIPATPQKVFTPIEHAAAISAPADPLVEQARRDPMSLVRLGRERYAKQITHYRCVLYKQERLGDELTPVQEVEVRYREAPRSVYMLWRANADQAKRALWVDGPEYVDKKGRKLARVEPAGAVARLLVKDLLVPIHGPEARKSSRRAIDECGFRSTFELLDQFNSAAAEKGVLDLRYSGTGQVDGRPTYVLTRTLPYEGPNGIYPDARMILHLDQQWLLPVAVYSYADAQEQKLLGSYVFTQIELNPDFAAGAFSF